MSGGGYRIVTPVGWDRIPLDESRRGPAVERIVRRQFRGSDSAPHLRAQLARLLSAEASNAAEAGGIDLYVSNLLHGPVPLESTLITSVVPFGAVGSPGLDELAAELAAGDAERVVDVCGVADLPAGRAVRRSSVRRAGSETVEDQRVEAPATFVVEWFVPTPECDRLLLLTFSTLLIPIRQAFAELFDAIAASLQWLAPAP